MIKTRFSLKTKLLLFSITILLIPWIGYKYVRGMETFLKSSMEEALGNRAHSLAIVLQQHVDLLSNQAAININNESEHLYLRPLDNPIQLDGYTDDWHFSQDLFQEYSEQHIIKKSSDHKPGSLHFRQATGSYKQHLFAVFKVNDNQITYHNPNNNRIDDCDHLRIALLTPQGKFQRYYLSTVAPGRIIAQLMPNDPDNNTPIKAETRIQGAWQETAEGYTLEIRLPISMIGSKLSFAINDVDDPQAGHSGSIIGSASTEHLSALSTIKVPSSGLEKLLNTLGMDSSRIWVIDKNKRVLALSGNLQAVTDTDASQRSVPTKLLSLFYRLILQQPAASFEDILSGVSKLNGREIETALSGKPTVSWRETSDQNATILTATHPVMSHNAVIGAVMLEQNSQRILLMQNRAMEELINLSIPVFLGGTLLIVLFAGRLTSRISHLRNQTEQAITSDGKVAHVFNASNSNDEIGDLSRTFSDLLQRLHQYNRYLESMASKLSHELRTPLSVVRSSLDNLEQVQPESTNNTYLLRAKEGLERLNNILNRLSEASRLEQAIQQADKVTVDLSALLQSCVAGYQTAYPQHPFKLTISEQNHKVLAAPDLIVQMLDKLVTNAIDFSQADTTIEIRLDRTDDQWIRLSIFNQGPPLPVEMQENLFDSMISVRPTNTRSSHLGLGLYIVRLIIEFHQGRVEARNMDTPDGVVFMLYFKPI